jgi:Glycine transporter
MTPAATLDLIAVFIFALTGGLVASRAQLDIVGFLFLACPVSGAARSAIWCLGPVFWVGSPHYLAVACAAAILAFFTAHRLESRYRAIPWLDALALSVAAAAGVSIAREARQRRSPRGDRRERRLGLYPQTPRAPKGIPSTSTSTRCIPRSIAASPSSSSSCASPPDMRRQSSSP